ncbi:excalibur calcium-binding domain-containing protein [Corynebacterium stationis]|uniref:excalibur calcium-binding domain-containing protein n=1 Tax=Corynebacterium stationis TaxID=1705 RepID=UPI00076F8C2A|nr:excalibur calcium-binding domain-containing protein [Corynebacterium stationis]AMJ44220.1 hypothetical protein AW169_04340 [Corynebacterium stationis]AQX70680.1 hypothetical protein CA21670_03510 [Corynebacterium stationis]ASJ18369.1 hypothetical protein BA700_04340 [Corynebacterium stationis]HJG63457.1 excalibur calcium-binding domain-containing protein [Corynebacterium stationis]
MYKRIIPAIVAASLAFSVVPSALAEEHVNVENQELEQNQEGQVADPKKVEEGSSDLEIIAGVAVIAGVVAAIAGGVHWAVQQRMIPNPLPGIIPNPPAPKKAAVKKAAAKPAPKPAAKPAPKPAPKPAAKPAPAKQAVAKPAPAPRPAQTATYKNCTDVWNKLGRSIYPRDAGFQSKFDPDGDGVGCERDPR